MNNLEYVQLLRLILPEAALVITVLAVLAWDQFLARRWPPEQRFRGGLVLAGLGGMLALAWLIRPAETVVFQQGMWLVNPMVRLLKAVLVILFFSTAVLSLEYRFTRHAGELLALLALATLGLMLLVSTHHLLLIFTALELTSLVFYVLTALNRHSTESAEAALKYFLFGGVSAAFLLFGLSLVYGLTGELLLPQAARALARMPGDPLVMVALVMVVIGFGFKIAAVPFHAWAPDVYQGAPAPVAAFIASASKVGSFYVLAQILVLGFGGVVGRCDWGDWLPGWKPVLAVLAVLSIVLGNVAALAQRRVRRLLAYSAIAHAGYMLVGLLAGNTLGISSLVYYVVTYAAATLGAFGVVAVVEAHSGGDAFGNFAGLHRQAPMLALCLLVFLLSLAGVPPLAGFFGKAYLFIAALQTPAAPLGLFWLVATALIMSVVSFYYYLQVLKQVYVQAPANPKAAIPSSPATQLVIGALALVVLLLGILPELVVGKLGPWLLASGW